ncbi:beta-lactamase/transpeptidase-like protein [Mycena vitilis]|nr:beta-lactamase/transpeptidase-like protein [Mycena vitilis]
MTISTARKEAMDRILIAALQLIEQGKIGLDTAVETVLPELANPVVVTAYDEEGKVRTTTPAKGKITFGQLLSHSSGLGYSADSAVPAIGLPPAYTHRYKDGEDVSTFFKIIKGSLPGIPLKCEPGTDFTYGFSTDCLGFIVERLSGKSLEQYFQEHIFTPLGITSASFYLTPALKDRLLPLSYRTKSGQLEKWNGPPEMEQDPAHVRVHMGGVGLYASQKDYLLLLQHLLQITAGSVKNPILSRASVNSLFSHTLPPAAATTISEFVGMFHPRLGLPPNAGQFGRGLFVTTADVPGKRKSGSGSWDGYASTSFFIDPSSGVAAIFATQLVPTADATHERFYDMLERELYAAL